MEAGNLGDLAAAINANRSKHSVSGFKWESGKQFVIACAELAHVPEIMMLCVSADAWLLSRSTFAEVCGL